MRLVHGTKIRTRAQFTHTYTDTYIHTYIHTYIQTEINGKLKNGPLRRNDQKEERDDDDLVYNTILETDRDGWTYYTGLLVAWTID